MKRSFIHGLVFNNCLRYSSYANRVHNPSTSSRTFCKKACWLLREESWRDGEWSSKSNCCSIQHMVRRILLFSMDMALLLLNVSSFTSSDLSKSKNTYLTNAFSSFSVHLSLASQIFIKIIVIATVFNWFQPFIITWVRSKIDTHKAIVVIRIF